MKTKKCPKCNSTIDITKDVRIVNASTNISHTYCSYCLQVTTKVTNEDKQ